MTLTILFIFAVVSIVSITLWYLIWFLGPKPPSEEELRLYQIHAEIPSLFQNFSGVRMHYHQLGSGPDIVFLHGIGASTFIWRLLLPLLSSNFRVTAIDLPGFGLSQILKESATEFNYDLDSMAEFIKKFLNTLGVSEFAIVGSSMGGTIALWIAKNFAAHCHNVVTIAAATHPSLVRYPPIGLRLMRPLRYFINKKTMFVAVENVIRKKELITDDLVNGYLFPYRDNGEAWRSLLKATAIISDRRLPQALAELNSQLNFRHKMLWGDDDRVVPRWVQEELKSILPKSEFIILPGLGHHPFEEDPALIASHIEDFLTK